MKERGFEILTTDASIKLKACGKNLEELFINSLRGVTSCLKSESLLNLKKTASQKIEIKVHAVDIPSLLIQFLTEALAQSDFHSTAFTHVLFKKFGDNFLEGKLVGSKIGEFDTSVRAISDEVEIEKNHETGLYEAQLVLEV